MPTGRIGVENKNGEFSHMLVARVIHVRKESASRYVLGVKFISPLGDDELQVLLEDAPTAGVRIALNGLACRLRLSA